MSYKKLWKLLIDRDLKKQDLMAMTKISPSSIAKLTKGENVNTDVLVKICDALECDFFDIMEKLPDDKKIDEAGCEHLCSISETRTTASVKPSKQPMVLC